MSSKLLVRAEGEAKYSPTSLQVEPDTWEKSPYAAVEYGKEPDLEGIVSDIKNACSEEQIGDELKLDFNKPDWSLLPLKTVEEVVKVLGFGAKKYSRHGWKDMAAQRHRVEAALLRHLAKRQAGQLHDEETGLLETAHLMCNALFLLHYDLQEDGYDD